MSVVSPNSIVNDQAKTTSRSRLLIGICTLREADNVVDMLGALRASCPHADLLVVDDQSEDGTADLARQFAARDHATAVAVRQPTGLGGAIATTMQVAVKGSYDFLVNLDADFSHDPKSVPSLVQRCEDSGAGVTIGSRYIAGGRIEGWPLYRRWMSRRINRMAIRRLHLPVSDCSGSMRCYRVDELRKLDPATLRSPGYAILEEILHRLNQQGTMMNEVPITFVDRREGESKLTLREAVRSFWQIVRLRS